jgi:hypothetical protein
VRTIRILAHRSSFACLVTVLVIAAVLAGCGNQKAGEAQSAPPPSPVLLPTVQSTVQPTVKPTVQPTLRPTPTLFALGPLVSSNLGLKSGPVDLPLELQIPSLHVNAPMLGVGLTPDKAMDAPIGSAGNPNWHTAFWYRGGGVPGDVGIATIAGHVNDPLGKPEIFAHIQDLHPGDLIIIHVKNTDNDIRFIVDQVKVYADQQLSDPAVLTQIFGAGPVTGIGPQPAPDGLSHLTLITCAGKISHGLFDQRTVVYATRSK